MTIFIVLVGLAAGLSLFIALLSALAVWQWQGEQEALVRRVSKLERQARDQVGWDTRLSDRVAVLELNARPVPQRPYSPPLASRRETKWEND